MVFGRKETGVSSDEKKTLRSLEKALGYSFKKKQVLKRALTHKSFANEQKLPPSRHNERIEFLGDAVLELSVSELLMEKFPDFSEGDLSKLRAAIVNEKQLAQIARGLRLGEFLYRGRGEEQTSGREKSSLLADVFDALLGGIYLDGGYKKAATTVRKHYVELLAQSPVEQFYRDYKTDLQEKSQAVYRSVPRYKLVAERGPDHAKLFEVELYIRDRLMGHGTGRSKKDAEQEAAKQGLEKLQHFFYNLVLGTPLHASRSIGLLTLSPGRLSTCV